MKNRQASTARVDFEWALEAAFGTTEVWFIL